MRNTESVQGPMPLMPAKASSQACPCCTLVRISSDLCRIVTQHCARRSGRPIARRLSAEGSATGDGLVRCECAVLSLSARRQAICVVICCAMTIRTSPQIGSSVGRMGQRAGWEAITCASVASRDERRGSGGRTASPFSEARRASFVLVTWAPRLGFQPRLEALEVGRTLLSLFRLVRPRPSRAT